MGLTCDTWHHAIRGKSQSGWIRIRVKSHGPMRNGHVALRGLVSCPNLDQMDWERKREGKREQTEERRKVWDF